MESENKKTLEEALADLEARKAAVTEWKREHGPALEAAMAKNDALNTRVAALSQKDRRQVLDAAGMKHVSAAPAPLEHIRGSGYSPPNKPPEPIDWEHWGFMRDCDVSLWEAVALSLNVNPDAVRMDKAGEDFNKRLRLAVAHGDSGSLPLTAHYPNQPVSPVILAKFAAWAVKLNIANMPPELVAIAAQPQASNVNVPEPQAAIMENGSAAERQTAENRDGIRGLNEEYESLAKLIEPYADGPFDELPEGLGERVASAFSPVAHWDDLTPNRRRLLARQRDNHNDPTNRPEMEYDLTLFDEIEKTKTEITNLELLNNRTPSDARIKREDLNALGGRLGKLIRLQTLPPFLVKDWTTLTNDALAEVVAANTAQAIQPQAAPDGTESASGGVEPANQNDTANRLRRRLLSEIIWKTEPEITKWEKMNAGGIPSEALVIQNQLALHRDRREKLETLFENPAVLLKDLKTLTDADLDKAILDAAHDVIESASGGVESAKAGPGWRPKTSIERAPGYRWPLFQVLKAAYIAGQPCPKARDVLNTWELNPPSDVQVMSDGVKYNDSLGNPKEANLKAIQQAIKGLLES